MPAVESVYLLAHLYSSPSTVDVIAQKLDLSRFPAGSKLVMMDQENIEDVKAVISQIPPDNRGIRIIRLSASGNANPDEICEIDTTIATAPILVLSQVEVEFTVRICKEEMDRWRTYFPRLALAGKVSWIFRLKLVIYNARSCTAQLAFTRNQSAYKEQQCGRLIASLLADINQP
ncbi:hypothetical protein FB451DRAFT_1186967 [Mycena latifolia]|nr:hypothetical protein FB451DRAFT_1186967 [Mycena latifolia]